jgi:hypothetical protein
LATQDRRGGGRADTFDAGQYGTLRYDFKAFGGVQGIIPDPSDEQIENFMRGMRDAAKEFGQDDDLDVDSLTAEELQELMEDDSNLRIKDAQDRMCELISELCSGSPNKEQLLALPLRVRQGFTRWLQTKLLDPEAGAAASTPSRVTRLGG